MKHKRARRAKKEQFGRERFLRRIAPLRRHPISVKKGMNPRAALMAILDKAGVSAQDLNEIRTKSDAYTRAAGDAFVASLERRRLSGMPYVARAAQFAKDVRYPGQIPTKGIVVHKYFPQDFPAPPPPPPPQYLPPDSAYRDCHISGKGVGDGVDWPWVTDDGTRGGFCDIEWQFSFTPPATNIYTFSSAVWWGGKYYLVANDQWYDSKEAWIDLSCSLGVNQQLPGPVQLPNGMTADSVQQFTPDVSLFHEDGQNILDGGASGGAGPLNLSVLLFGNYPVDISITAYVSALARGGGSVVDFNLARPDGALACGGLGIA